MIWRAITCPHRGICGDEGKPRDQRLTCLRYAKREDGSTSLALPVPIMFLLLLVRVLTGLRGARCFK